MKNKRILSLGMAVTMLVSVLAAPVNVHAYEFWCISGIGSLTADH